MCDFDRIESLLDNTLPEEERSELRRHMETCPACRHWYQALEELRRPVAAPSGFRERVMSEVRATPQSRRKSPHRWMPVAVAAACLVLVAGIGVGAAKRSDAPPAGTMAREIQESYSGSDATASYRCQSADGTVVSDTLTEEQTEAVRSWLAEQVRAADKTDAEGTPLYTLTGEEAAALNRAVPGLALPETELWLYLPN